VGNQPEVELRLLFGMTSGLSARSFIGGQGPFFRERGWDVHLTCSSEADVALFAAAERMTFHPVPLERNPSPSSDARAFWNLASAVRDARPSVVVWGSPKASLFGVLICRVLRIPAIYVIHGLRLEGMHGLGRLVLWAFEATTCRLATRVVADGFDLRDLAVRLRLVGRKKIQVLAHGSANGIEVAQAEPRYRRLLDLNDDAVVVTFAGRITSDKGMAELHTSWLELAEACPTAHLVVAGRADEADPMGEEWERRLRELPRTHLLGHISDLDRLWSDTDVLVLPSYREGLPLVVIEAAAAGVPAVVSNCTGCAEAVADGETGVVVPVRDPSGLTEALLRLVRSPQMRARMGEAARNRAVARYDRSTLWDAWDTFLRSTMKLGHRHVHTT
jgi:glycosyltransferase involved in cell wall biosynthesis